MQQLESARRRAGRVRRAAKLARFNGWTFGIAAAVGLEAGAIQAMVDKFPESRFSVTREGETPRQVAEGAGVVTSRADVHTVVTEHGAAELRGRSIRERVDALIAIADPKFQPELEQAVEDVHRLTEIPGLKIDGLMTMAPFVDDEAVLAGAFRGLRETLEGVSAVTDAVGAELSMGMTNDLEIAIREGSTMVRIGTALFGPRVRGPQ